MRRLLRHLANVLIVAGILLVIDAGLTVLWQEPVSAVYANLNQGRLSDELERIDRRNVSALQRRVLARLDSQRQRVAFLARDARRRAGAGDPLGRIIIPRTKLSSVMVQGTDADSLQKGPGHFPETPVPGIPGTVAVAGHRTTYSAPFRDNDDLRPGDSITLDMPYARFRYRVEGTKIVKPTATWVTRSVGYDRLVLTACHPLYSAALRIVVFARLVSTKPKGPARL